MKQKEIDTHRLREWLDSGSKVTILDIRPIHERQEWHIPGSIHQDVYDELVKGNPDALESIELDKSVPVVTVCSGGKTSQIAAALLQKAGYEAYSLQGGMKSWSLSWNTAEVSFDNFELIQFRRTGKGCLSYLIVSEQEAMVVDASLPVEVYEKVIRQRNLTLKYVMDTHIHADHLSRSKMLADAYGLIPSIAQNDKLNFPFHPITDNTIFSLGKVEVNAVHTPGHTSESTCYLVDGKALLTGDTLFTNGVGRPDLKVNQEGAKHKASQLYQSLRKLLKLDKSIVVLPGHTSQPIAFDHKVIQAELGQVESNLSLLKRGEETFVQTLLDRIPDTPVNYLTILEKNLTGDFSNIDPIDLEAGANRCAIT
ncbi:MBL fold metallo-hydrolase [Algoriphagus sp. D3-2-R+10]|uniref:MBL fold metallo-hydrolase n=1 Tax=Algoriphagus aurantiacus TaxID=3103948 RepID=UPI002B3B372F|nr:MBL fold metallo-hydrolase [Algoriphagus sp. D3-2-R+10]MEB2778603.1 MBL fold metallo-hydrolase [Algoriphagus sp. D3-2-R+10]